MRKESGRLNISGGLIPAGTGESGGADACLCSFGSAAGEAFAGSDWPKMASSADGTAISQGICGVRGIYGIRIT